MTAVADVVAVLLMAAGCAFYLAGSVGLLRLPDVLSRLHALTKADNLGLGLVLAGVAVHVGSAPVAVKLAFTWLLALVAASTSSQLLARAAAADPAADPAMTEDP